ncbi:hypothetical protein EVA_02486 [gut metagenome]|uniref:Uncharacterized protein n=1 Tax=gut metagenome TaxID=749906 RepID=J9GMY0_9ZZZZ
MVYRSIFSQAVDIALEQLEAVVGDHYSKYFHEQGVKLVFSVNFSGLHTAVLMHEFEAFLSFETSCLGIFFSNPTVHLWCGRQSFQVFAASVDVQWSHSHAVQVDQLQENAFFCFFKEDIASAIVLVGIAMVV